MVSELSAVITMCLNEGLLGGKHTSVAHLVWAGVVVGASSDHEELAGAAGHGRGADGLLHGSHLCPAVGEGVVALDAAQAALAVVAAHGVDLRAHKGSQTPD